jgi:tetratricopeptide (TPR) repeat protein
MAIALATSSHIAAQDTSTPEAANTTIIIHFSPAPGPIAIESAQFADELSGEIEQAGLTLYETTNPTSADTVIAFRHAPESEWPEVYVDLRRDPLRGLSPLLDGRLQFSVELNAPDALELTTAALIYGAGRCDLALPYLEELSADHAVRGNCAILAGDLEAAAGHLAEAAAHDDIWNAPDRHLAWVYVQIDQADAAIALASAAIEAAPDDAVRVVVLTDRARLYALAFDYDSAIADADAAIDLAPDDAGLYVLRGQMILLLYEWDRALLDFDTAIALDSAYAEAYFYRGLLYYSVLERETALADFERYLHLAPDGDMTRQAAHYIESIRAELDALSGE